MKKGVTPDKYYKLEVQDTQSYSLTCDKGHITRIAMQQSKFELLFEMGCNAIADGYYREAIASFAASLERFYEIFIKASLFQNKVTNEEIEKLWKSVYSNSSERQIGAYSAIYSMLNSSQPTLLSKKTIELRNKTIHKGHIASKSEAIDYGQQVINSFIKDEVVLGTHLSEGVNDALMFEHIKAAGWTPHSGEGYQSSIFTMMVLKPSTKERNPPSVSDHVKLLEQHRELGLRL